MIKKNNARATEMENDKLEISTVCYLAAEERIHFYPISWEIKLINHSSYFHLNSIFVKTY